MILEALGLLDRDDDGVGGGGGSGGSGTATSSELSSSALTGATATRQKKRRMRGAAGKGGKGKDGAGGADDEASREFLIKTATTLRLEFRQILKVNGTKQKKSFPMLSRQFSFLRLRTLAACPR